MKMEKVEIVKIISGFVMVSVIAYTVAVIVLGHLNPGYSHVADLVSELGGTGSPYNFVLNITLMISGISLFRWHGLSIKHLKNR